MLRLTERISYLPASLEPLSSDIGFVHGDRYEWIFDLGSNEEALHIVQEIDREKNVILSHFHKDHTDNLKRISYDNLYCGDYTKKKFGKGIEVKAPITFEDGVRITMFPLPSLHSKGAVGLEVDEEYAFLGDVVYGMMKNGKAVFNINLLKEMILVLESLKAEKFLISHDAAFIKSKEEVIAELNKLYKMRRPGEAYVVLENNCT